MSIVQCKYVTIIPVLLVALGLLALYLLSTFSTIAWLLCPCWGKLARYHRKSQIASVHTANDIFAMHIQSCCGYFNLSSLLFLHKFILGPTKTGSIWVWLASTNTAWLLHSPDQLVPVKTFYLFGTCNNFADVQYAFLLQYMCWSCFVVQTILLDASSDNI